MDDDARPLLVVDAANVVGSVPDGWWRDRAGAAARLRDGLVGLETDGLDGLAVDGLPGKALNPPLEVVLVVEGAASRVRSVPGVRVVAASGSGDDAIVDLVATEGRQRHCLVVTADRELRRRVGELGADVTGPRTVYPPRPT